MTKLGSVIPFEFDSRMVEWNIKHKIITNEQLQNYLKTIPDHSGNSMTLEIDDTGASSGVMANDSSNGHTNGNGSHSSGETF